MKKTYKRDTEHAARVIKLNRITGLQKDTINAVIHDERKNEIVLDAYMVLVEFEQEIENLLLKSVKELLPFPKNNRLNAL